VSQMDYTGAIDSSRTDDISAFVCQERVVSEELCRAEVLQRCILDDAGRREEHLFDQCTLLRCGIVQCRPKPVLAIQVTF
jgi:hypothetical protein